jgi:hypothetical protein
MRHLDRLDANSIPPCGLFADAVIDPAERDDAFIVHSRPSAAAE